MQFFAYNHSINVIFGILCIAVSLQAQLNKFTDKKQVAVLLNDYITLASQLMQTTAQTNNQYQNTESLILVQKLLKMSNNDNRFIILKLTLDLLNPKNDVFINMAYSMFAKQLVTFLDDESNKTDDDSDSRQLVSQQQQILILLQQLVVNNSKRKNQFFTEENLRLILQLMQDG